MVSTSPAPDARRRRGPAPKSNHSNTIHIFSDDPEVKLIQGFVNGMHHMAERHLTVRHLKLLMTVHLIGKAFNGVQPDKKMIAAIAKMDVDLLEPELGDLVERRYLTEIIPTYGDIKPSYKLGSMGGTLLRHMFGPNKVVPSKVPVEQVVEEVR